MVAWGCKDLEIAIDCRDALGSHGPSLVTMDGVAIRINCSEHLAQHHHQCRNHGCTRRVVCVRVPMDRFGHVLCRLPLEHVTAARHVLCCGALSCRRPVGRAAGCGSRMRQQKATAESDSRWGRQSHDFGYFGRNNERALRRGMHEFRARAGRCCGRAWATGRLGSLNGSQDDDRSLLLTGGGAASRGRWLVRVREARVMADQGDWGSG
jgi:hypothetical protein